MSLPTLAITGGTGFVGSHLLTAARGQGYQVRFGGNKPGWYIQVFSNLGELILQYFKAMTGQVRKDWFFRKKRPGCFRPP